MLSHAVLQAPAPKNVARATAKSIKFADGLYYSVLIAGKGKASTKQYIKSLSTAWTSRDGKTQYNAKEDGIDVSAPELMAEVAPGLAVALKSTPIGEKRRWWIVSGLMKPGWGGMVQGDYTIDIEVLAELDPLPAPESVAQPPKGAIVSQTGLQYQILKQAKQGKKPKATDIVRVHYSGWTADGQMFDSSVLRDRKIEFPLNRVIKGWTEGLQYMSIGDKYRFWIPGNLAYDLKPRPGAPRGDLVFDVELFEIIEGK
jgi:peptidylprolyl isomerase